MMRIREVYNNIWLILWFFSKKYKKNIFFSDLFHSFTICVLLCSKCLILQNIGFS